MDGATTPRFILTDVTTYSLDRLQINLTTRYTSAIKYSTLLIGPDDPAFSLASTSSINQNLWSVPVYYNAAISYDYIDRPGMKAQFYFNIDNILDTQPPVVAWSLSGGPYDLVGRSFKVGVRLRY